MKKVGIPVVIVFVANHGYHLCRNVIETFEITIVARMAGAYREFVDTCNFINSYSKLGAELESVVGEEGGWTPPKRHQRVHHHIDDTLSCEFRGGDSEYTCTTVEAAHP